MPSEFLAATPRSLIATAGMTRRRTIEISQPRFVRKLIAAPYARGQWFGSSRRSLIHD